MTLSGLLLVHQQEVLLVRGRIHPVIVVHEERPVIRCIPAAISAVGFRVFDLRRYGLAVAVFLGVADARVVVAHAQVLRVGLPGVLAGDVDTLLRGLSLQEQVVVLDGFEIAHVLGHLLPFLRNITALLEACSQSLDLHLAVHVREEVLLRQVLIVRHLAAYSTLRLLHVAPGARLLLGRLHRVRLLHLVHLVDEHHIFHIGNLICLHSLLLLLLLLSLAHRALLLYVVDVVYLLLGAGATGASRAAAFDAVDRHRLVHPLLVLLLGRGRAAVGYRHLGLHLFGRQSGTLRLLAQLISAERRVLSLRRLWLDVGIGGAVAGNALHGIGHQYLPLRLFLPL